MSGAASDVSGPRFGVVWRIGVVFLAATGVMIAIRALVPDEYSRGLHAVRAVLLTLLLGGLALAACRWLDRRPILSLGLDPRGAGRSVVLGGLAWLVPAAAATAGCLLLGWVEIDVHVGAAALAATVASQLVLVLLLEAVPEELVFRGYLYTALADHTRTWTAIIAQAALFALWGLAAGGAQDPVRVALFFGVGIGLGYLREITGSLWAPIGFHLIFQTVAQLLSGTQVPAFTVTNEGLLQFLAYGIVPFAVGLPLVEHLVRNRGAQSRRRRPTRQ